MARKIVSEMTYNVPHGTLNSTILIPKPLLSRVCMLIVIIIISSIMLNIIIIIYLVKS